MKNQYNTIFWDQIVLANYIEHSIKNEIRQ